MNTVPTVNNANETESQAQMMPAVAVYPGKPNSAHLAQLEKPSIESVPNGRGVLVKVLRVGIDGTDKEINAGGIRRRTAGL